MKKEFNQLLAILEVEIKNLLRERGTVGFAIFFPILISLSTYGVGAGILGKAPNIDLWFYQLIGFTILMIAIFMSSSSAWYVRQGLLSRRLEYLFAASINPLIIVAASSITSGLMGIGIFLVVGLIGVLVVYGISNLLNFFLATIILAVSLIPILGINLIVAATTIIGKDPEAISQPLSAIVSTTSGLAYPITILPFILQIIGEVMPYYYAAEYVRAMINGYLNLVNLESFPFLFIYLIGGYFIYRYFEYNFIRKEGNYGA
jgi:ABC-2 type transporter.